MNKMEFGPGGGIWAVSLSSSSRRKGLQEASPGICTGDREALERVISLLSQAEPSQKLLLDEPGEEVTRRPQ